MELNPIFSDDRDECLAHYGVLGMKWGVRNAETLRKYEGGKGRKPRKEDQGDKKGLSERQKKAIKIGVAATAATLGVLGGVYLYKKYGTSNVGFSVYKASPLKESLHEFSDNNGVSLKKGTSFQRISSEAIEDYKKRGETFVSHTFRDNMKYKERMPQQSYIDGGYVHKLRMKEPVKAPSSRKAASIFLSQNPEATQAEYKRFMEQGIRDPSSGKRSAFVSELKKQGYNAVVDENDFGSGFTKSPLILLDPENLVDSAKSRKLSAAERVAAVYFK